MSKNKVQWLALQLACGQCWLDYCWPRQLVSIMKSLSNIQSPIWILLHWIILGSCNTWKMIIMILTLLNFLNVWFFYLKLEMNSSHMFTWFTLDNVFLLKSIIEFCLQLVHIIVCKLRDNVCNFERLKVMFSSQISTSRGCICSCQYNVRKSQIS